MHKLSIRRLGEYINNNIKKSTSHDSLTRLINHEYEKIRQFHTKTSRLKATAEQIDVTGISTFLYKISISHILWSFYRYSLAMQFSIGQNAVRCTVDSLEFVGVNVRG
jgi:hypothetical protein